MSSDVPVIRVALIGCGEHARVDLLPCLLQQPWVRVVAACDPDIASAASLRAILPSLAVYADYNQLFADNAAIDAIVVVGPPQINAAASREALLRRIHVFSEKPPAVTTAELRDLSALAESTGAVTTVGHNLRYADAHSAMLQELASEPPLCYEVRYITSGPCGDRWELRSPVRSFSLSHSIHVIDLALSVMGLPESIDAAATRLKTGSLVISGRLIYPDHRLALITIGDLGATFSLDEWAVTPRGVTLHVDSLRTVRRSGAAHKGKRWAEAWRPRTLSVGHDGAGYAGVLGTFFRAIQRGAQAAPTFSDEVETYNVLDQIESQIELAMPST